MKCDSVIHFIAGKVCTEAPAPFPAHTLVDALMLILSSFWEIGHYDLMYLWETTALGVPYDEFWVYGISGNILTVKNATGNPNIVLGGANVGYQMIRDDS